MIVSRRNGDNSPNRNRTIAGYALLLASTLALASCSAREPNQSGEGDRFRLRGSVRTVEKDGTIYIDKSTIIIDYAEGRAIGWLAGTGKSDQDSSIGMRSYYNKLPGSIAEGCELAVQTGHIFNINNTEINAENLAFGSAITVIGSIRDSSKSKSLRQTAYCTTNESPVYEIVLSTQMPTPGK